MPLVRLSIGDFDAAEALVQREAPALIGQGRWKVVVDWTDACPKHASPRIPGCCTGAARPGSASIRRRRGPCWNARMRSRLPKRRRTLRGAVRSRHGGRVLPRVHRVHTGHAVDRGRWNACSSPDFVSPNAESELRALGRDADRHDLPRSRIIPAIERCAERMYALLTTQIDTNLRVSAGTYPHAVRHLYRAPRTGPQRRQHRHTAADRSRRAYLPPHLRVGGDLLVRVQRERLRARRPCRSGESGHRPR